MTITMRSLSRSSWHELPPEILLRIFKYLGDKERCGCAGTCHHWREIMDTPELWRERTFTFGKSLRRAATFMNTYGRHLTDLNLNFLHWRTMSDNRMNRLEEFLKQIPPGLKRFGIKFSREIQTISLSSRKTRIVTHLCDMLRLQKNLDGVDFSKCYLSDEDSFRLLEALNSAESTPASQTSPPTFLTDLAIKGLFRHFDNAVVGSFVQVMGKFTTLQRLSINCILLHDNCLLEVLIVANPHLKDLLLEICGPYEFFIFSQDMIRRNTLASNFQDTVSKSRELRVYLDIIDCELNDWPGQYVIDHLQDVLVPTLPLVSFRYRNAQNLPESRMDEMAEHLLYVARHFRQLTILFVQTGDRAETWNRPDALIQLVMACPALTRLVVMKKVPFETVLKIATAHSAETLHLVVAGCDNLDLEKLSGTRCFVSVKLKIEVPITL